MVALKDMRAHNASLTARPPGLVALFTGATKGIGAETVRELLTQLDSPKIYIVGRDASKFAGDLSKLRALNAKAKIEFIEANVALIREVDRVADLVLAAEHHLDLLCMSPGHLPVGGAKYTEEGIDQCMALSFYGRVLLANKMLPLLQKASQPRVMSILAGGDEKQLFVDDLDLKKNYSLLNAMGQLTSLNTLAFARLAGANPSIAFVHSHPGVVATDILSNALTSDKPGLLGAVSRFSVSNLVVPMLHTFVTITPRESGERMAFLLTSDRYVSAEKRKADGSAPLCGDVEVVNGLYLINQQGEMKVNRALLQKWMTDGTADKVWDHTMSVSERAKRA